MYTIICLPIRNISIHAPERGATFYGLDRTPVSNISIHAPERGATQSF